MSVSEKGFVLHHHMSEVNASISEALAFDPSANNVHLITSYEGLNVYHDGSSYFCKGIINLEAEKMYNHYMENDHKDMMKVLNELLTNALLWGHNSQSPTTPTMANEGYMTWTVAVPFMRQRVYAYTRQGHSVTLNTGQLAFVIVNEAIKDTIPLSYFSYQVFNYWQKAVLIQQENGLCFIYVCYHDPDTVIPSSICHLVVQLYVPYFVKKMYKSCTAPEMVALTQDTHVKAINDALEQSIKKGFMM